MTRTSTDAPGSSTPITAARSNFTTSSSPLAFTTRSTGTAPFSRTEATETRLRPRSLGERHPRLDVLAVRATLQRARGHAQASAASATTSIRARTGEIDAARPAHDP